MITLTREEKIWSYGFILVGIPAMVVGFTLGYRHDNPATMYGAIAVAVIILLVNFPAFKK